jgi:uncharacterized protein involved in exopolysaccharide biosynthesis
MKRAIEIFKRRKRLVLIPFLIVFVIPVILGLIFMRSYEADSMIWLDSNSSVSSVLQQHGAGTPSETPIQGEANSLKQLLESRAFVGEIISKTPLQSEMSTPSDREKTLKYVRKNLRIDVVGPNSVRVTFRGRTADDRVRLAARQQSEKTTGLFADQSGGYRDQLEKANSELQAFREQHRETQQLDIAERLLTPPKISVSAAVQTEYARLKLAADYAQQLYDQSLSDLGQARVLSALQEDRYTNGFRTMDEPVAPTRFSLKRMLLFDLLAFTAACIVAGIAVAWAEYSDRTLYSERDVVEALDLPVLTEIPRGPDTAKRA